VVSGDAKFALPEFCDASGVGTNFQQGTQNVELISIQLSDTLIGLQILSATPDHG